jgi:hypothetical protein
LIHPTCYAALVLNGFLLLLATICCGIGLALTGLLQQAVFCLLALLVPFAWRAWLHIAMRCRVKQASLSPAKQL